jgi:isopentenyldiphosphate isomerase
MTTPLAQDPDELFDVVTADGAPTSITKRRADIHRDGDWHRAIHVWVYGVEDEGKTPFLLLNQRGKHKDTWPGVLDATVGGHLAAGETVEEAFREIEEEIGISADPARLRFVGTRPRSSESMPGIIDREIQEVFLYRDDRPLTGYRPNPTELEGLVQIDLAAALRLFAEETDRIAGMLLSTHDHAVTPLTVTREMLLPVRVDRYFLRVAVAIDQLLRGEKYVLV